MHRVAGFNTDIVKLDTVTWILTFQFAVSATEAIPTPTLVACSDGNAVSAVQAGIGSARSSYVKKHGI